VLALVSAHGVGLVVAIAVAVSGSCLHKLFGKCVDKRLGKYELSVGRGKFLG
jgi:hypothetical protein